jgi:hypothetical protein
MSQDQARLWLHGLEPDAKPVYVHARAEGIEHRVHTAQYHSGKDQEHVRPEFYERIINLIRDADGVLLVGHGNGKARATDNFDQYLTRKYYELWKLRVKVIEQYLQRRAIGLRLTDHL